MEKKMIRMNETTLNEYQDLASVTMLPQCRNAEYLGLGLAGEAGEFCDKLKRIIRGDGILDDGILHELGDILWYVSQLAHFYHADLETIARMNLEKLEKRKKSGKIKGTGDDR